jgi:hypothetical protein
MASLDSLPGDQRAVLELVLGRRRSYDEIAGLLSIDRGAVRDRALAALDALGPPTELSADDRRTICDYLLGQLPAAQADAVHERLAGSPAERAWARVVSGELTPLADGPLPEIPDNGAPADAPPTPAAAPAPAGAPPAGPRSSRRGGVIVLGLGAAAVIAAVIVVVIVTSSGGGPHHEPVAAASSSTTTAAARASTTTSSTTAAKVVAQINLDPTAGGSKAAGVAEVLQQGNTKGIAVVAQNMVPNTKKPANAYALWLYNSPTSAKFLGFVTPGVAKNGKLQTAGALPAGASGYKQLIVTLETSAKPKSPGQVILRGALTGV